MSIIALLFANVIFASHLLAASKIVHLQAKRLDDSYIDAYLAMPVQEARLPLLIMCQGTGTDSQADGFFGITEPWADKAVRLVVEKYGVKQGDKGDRIPAGYLEHNTIYNRCLDYLRVLQHLRNNASWWNGEVYVVGGSEGGLLSGMLASYYPAVKRAAIISYGGMLTMSEAWPVAKAKMESGGDTAMSTIIRQQTIDSFAAFRSHPLPTETYDGNTNTKMWWASIIDIRLANALLDVDIPLLVIHASDDQMMPVQSARELSKIFEQYGKSNLTCKEYGSMDHSFKDKNGKSHYKEILQEAVSWLLGKP